MRLWALCCALSCALALRAPVPLPQHRDVNTSSGVARGYLKPRPPHYAFLGLPYARPPAARARFKAAEGPMQWDGVFEATYRVSCAQPGRKGDEACLALNVFAPEHAERRPVLVHLHAGHFATGWGSHRAPPRILKLGFVVVTLNYRLGADGFLCLGTGGAPGNAGLKDQVAALKWVYVNINLFGGDAEQITLYGTGAGAAAAELLLLSGAVDGFIQRVIMEGGSALMPTALANDPVGAALEVATALGYEDANTNTNLDLTNFYQDIPVWKTLNFSNRFVPCVESIAQYYSALLIKDPKEILQSAILSPVPLLIAYSKERSLDDDTLFHNVPNNFEDLLPNNLEFESGDVKFKIGEQVKQSYFSDSESDVNIVEHFENYINDVFTVYPIVKSATLHAAASNSPVYLMEFIPRVESNTIFEYIFSREQFGEEEELIAGKLLAMWSNFMVYSDPTPLETTQLPEVWLPVTFRERNEKPDISTVSCLTFDFSQISMSMDTPSSGHTLVIWDYIYDNFYKSHTPKVELSDSELMLYNTELALIATLTNSQEGYNQERSENKFFEFVDVEDTTENVIDIEVGEGNEYISTKDKRKQPAEVGTEENYVKENGQKAADRNDQESIRDDYDGDFDSKEIMDSPQGRIERRASKKIWKIG